MASVIKRLKVQPIYDTVGGWWENKGGVYYVAHAILANGTIRQLYKPVSTEKGNTSKSTSEHPDQKYWTHREMDKVLAEVAKDIVRIEIDCSLMPCDGQNGCLTTVPRLVGNLLKNREDTKLRIFSHRFETPTGNKEYFDTSVKASSHLSDFKGRGTWTWTSPEKARQDPSISVDVQGYAKDLNPI
jgi:hypothetical protein